MKLRELAERLGAELSSNGDTDITGVAGIEHAGPTQITFVSNPRYAGLARSTQAAAIIVAPDFEQLAAPTLRIKNPYFAFSRALALFYQGPQYAPGVHPTAAIDPTARLGSNCHVGAYAVLGPGVVVGEGSTILSHVVLYPGVRTGKHFFAHAHAVVRENCVLGDDVTLQNGAIVGSDGFGFAQDGNGDWQKIPQSGPVLLEDQVEVQANACIDRATVGETVIGRNAKIDNLVQVGHGSKVGERTLLCAQVGLAGSTTVGRSVVLAGQVGVAGHCTIGDGVVATAQSGIPNDVPRGTMVSGYPAMENRRWLRSAAGYIRLPDLIRQVDRLTKAVNKLTSDAQSDKS